MNKKIIWSSVGSLLILASQLAFAHPEHQVKMPKEFEPLTKLVGTWEGTGQKEGKEEPASVVYAITSGGTALTERMNPGAPDEMITVYHKDGNSVSMTHFCAMGNQPRMKLKSSDGKVMKFEMVGASGVSSMKEMHMHALTLTFVDSDTLKQEWTGYQNGKKAGVMTFLFKRKK
jgi:hypothetical protein